MGDPLVDDSWPIEKGVTMSILQNPLRTHIHLTGEAAWHVPAHWHAVHDERHIVLKGRIIVTQDGVKKVIRPEDGPSITLRGVVHSIEVPAGEEVILEETTLQSVEVVRPIPDNCEKSIRLIVLYRLNRKLCSSATYHLPWAQTSLSWVLCKSSTTEMHIPKSSLLDFDGSNGA